MHASVLSSAGICTLTLFDFRQVRQGASIMLSVMLESAAQATFCWVGGCSHVAGESCIMMLSHWPANDTECTSLCRAYFWAHLIFFSKLGLNYGAKRVCCMIWHQICGGSA
jgi:hypothetical protein